MTAPTTPTRPPQHATRPRPTLLTLPLMLFATALGFAGWAVADATGPTGGVIAFVVAALGGYGLHLWRSRR